MKDKPTKPLPLKPYQEHILVLTDRALDELTYDLKHHPDLDAARLFATLRQYADLLERATAEGDNPGKRHFAATIIASAIRLSRPVYDGERPI